MNKEFKRLLLNLLLVCTEERGAMRRSGFLVYVFGFQKAYPDIEPEKVKALEQAMYQEPGQVDQLCHQYLDEEGKNG